MAFEEANYQSTQLDEEDLNKLEEESMPKTRKLQQTFVGQETNRL